MQHAISKRDDRIHSTAVGSRPAGRTGPAGVLFRRRMAISVRAAGCWVCMSLVTGCATLTSEHAAAPDSGSQLETGTASYYPARYQNRKTASGQRLDNSAMTAAHRTLPFGTEVVVRNVSNGKSVRVTINDRGPFVEGRVIDLTRAAFAQIADLNAGLVKVEIQVVH